MESIILVMYVILGVVFGLTMFVIVMVVAGKDILMAFKRWIFKRGCDVYLANQTRTISHFYMVPKDGVFRIRDNPYITNPEKTMNLTDEERNRVMDYILKREKRIHDRITDVNEKISKLDSLLEISKSEKQKYFIKSQIQNYKGVVKEYQDKLRLKQENYFKDKRPAFFYIEGDPIPKDFYEYYSALDSKMVDNLVSRSISQPADKKADSDVKLMKMLVIGAAIAAAVAAFFAFQNNSAVHEICRVVGGTCGGG